MMDIWPEIDSKLYWRMRRNDDDYDPVHFLRIPCHIFVKPEVLKKFQKKEEKKLKKESKNLKGGK